MVAATYTNHPATLRLDHSARRYGFSTIYISFVLMKNYYEKDF